MNNHEAENNGEKKKKGIRIPFGHYEKQVGYRMKEIFIGKRTIFSLLGFLVGSLLVGRSIWEYLMNHYSLFTVTIVGLVIFIVSGLTLHEFHDYPKEEHPRDKDEYLV